MKQEFQAFIAKFKDQISSKKTVLFDENEKLAGFISYSKPEGQREGYDCPVKKEESLKERLKRVSKPKLVEIEEND